MIPDGRDKRLNVRIEEWRRQDYRRFAEAHPDQYRDLSDFVIQACNAEMDPEKGKKRFILMLKKALIEDQEIRELLDKHFGSKL